MRFLDCIIKKRENIELSENEIRFFIQSYINNEISDYQVSAFLMTIFFNGLNFKETALLTREMILSGERYDFSDLSPIPVDKHSTGGVGDKLSLIIAPIAAACGCVIPMMSGRGLGHTGGTLDKLESIPGYSVYPDYAKAKTIMKECGFVMMGQTDSIVPADKKLYALRDVTGTVESIPLITASIMSKKIAEGTKALVIDLKCGSGAFMKNITDARKLAEYMIGVARESNIDLKIVISNMDQPIGMEVGNFNEVLESYKALKNEGDSTMMDLVYRLCGWMIVSSGNAKNITDAIKKAKEAVVSGRALELFLKNVSMQGGDINALLNPINNYKNKIAIKSNQDGYIKSIDAYKIGIASMHVNCGRKTKESVIDLYAGISILHKSGDYVKKGDCLFELFYSSGDYETAIKYCNDSVSYSDKPIEKAVLVIEEMC